uniref:Secreted protein n=1 Tax=Mesocestoides corti TaxID=53468 RepID=A0A5K3FS01_MESCO
MRLLHFLPRLMTCVPRLFTHEPQIQAAKSVLYCFNHTFSTDGTESQKSTMQDKNTFSGYIPLSMMSCFIGKFR